MKSYPLALPDALPIFGGTARAVLPLRRVAVAEQKLLRGVTPERQYRSEEHTSELQSHLNPVCRLLREKNNNNPAATSTATREDTLHTCSRHERIAIDR